MNALPRWSVLVVAVLLGACGDVARSTSSRLGVQGGTLKLESGLQVEVPTGALKQEVELTLREVHRGDDTLVEVEPRGLRLDQPLSVSWDDDGRVAERESGERLEIERHGGRHHRGMIELQPFWLRRHGGDDADGGHRGGGDDDLDGGHHGGGDDDLDGGHHGGGDDDLDGGHHDGGDDDLDGGVDGGDDDGGVDGGDDDGGADGGDDDGGVDGGDDDGGADGGDDDGGHRGGGNSGP